MGALALAAALTGCASYNPIPDGYAGPRAKIKDSFEVHSRSKADFFSVEAVDGQRIENGRILTRVRNSGRGLDMTPHVVEREVPVRPLTLRLVGRTEYAAPILALTNTVYEVKGDVQFVPQAGKTYVVYGRLSESNSAVWIEEDGGDVVEGTRVEVKGSAALGVLQK